MMSNCYLTRQNLLDKTVILAHRTIFAATGMSCARKGKRKKEHIIRYSPSCKSVPRKKRPRRQYYVDDHPASHFDRGTHTHKSFPPAATRAVVKRNLGNAAKIKPHKNAQ